jgi:hypothetical protein
MNLFVEIDTVRNYILMPPGGGIKIFIITSAYGLELFYSLYIIPQESRLHRAYTTWVGLCV